MSATRTERRERDKYQRRRLLAVAGVTALVVALITTAIALTGIRRSRMPTSSPIRVASAEAASATHAPLDATPQLAEVPNVVGRPLVEAEMILSLAGFDVRRSEIATASPRVDRQVLAESPSAGAKLEIGSVVVVSHAPSPPAAGSAPRGTFVVCIDPGHQQQTDSKVEPIGPGSSETKACVTGGATGVASNVPEYQVDLLISQLLKQRLEAAGVQVVMTRTANDVHLSNAQRAAVANRAGADLFVRVHCNANVDEGFTGVGTLFPDSNQWTAPIVARSKRAAASVENALVAETGAVDRGTSGRGDITGFNWSKVPAILVECGFLSNAREDRLLASEPYRRKVADGIAKGVLAYLQE